MSIQGHHSAGATLIVGQDDQFAVNDGGGPLAVLTAEWTDVVPPHLSPGKVESGQHVVFFVREGHVDVLPVCGWRAGGPTVLAMQVGGLEADAADPVLFARPGVESQELSLRSVLDGCRQEQGIPPDDR